INYTKDFPAPIDNKYMKVVNAGYWLANTNGKLSQLVYILEMTNKRVFSQDVVYTKSIFSNPEDESKPIIYNGTLNNVHHTVKVTHATVQNVTFNKKYHLIFEIYSDQEQTELISRIDQIIVAPVDNTTGCVQISSEVRNDLFSVFAGTNIPIACDR
ncbi:MAG: hypothetical protein Q9M14_07140, partial [Mariprofundaceae bacterium]|nr:hypothetical protein [Mariprofundaceae bacterium]